MQRKSYDLAAIRKALATDPTGATIVAAEYVTPETEATTGSEPIGSDTTEAHTTPNGVEKPKAKGKPTAKGGNGKAKAQPTKAQPKKAEQPTTPIGVKKTKPISDAKPTAKGGKAKSKPAPKSNRSAIADWQVAKEYIIAHIEGVHNATDASTYFNELSTDQAYRLYQTALAWRYEVGVDGAMAWDDLNGLSAKKKQTEIAKRIAAARKAGDDDALESAKAELKEQKAAYKAEVSERVLNPNYVLKEMRAALASGKYPDIVAALHTKSPQIKHTLRMEGSVISRLYPISSSTELRNGDLPINLGTADKPRYCIMRAVDMSHGNVKRAVEDLRKSIKDLRSIYRLVESETGNMQTPKEFIESHIASPKEIEAAIADKVSAKEYREYRERVKALHAA